MHVTSISLTAIFKYLLQNCVVKDNLEEFTRLSLSLNNILQKNPNDYFYKFNVFLSYPFNWIFYGGSEIPCTFFLRVSGYQIDSSIARNYTESHLKGV